MGLDSRWTSGTLARRLAAAVSGRDRPPLETVILGFAKAIETRDGSTHGHCERLARYARAFGVRLGLPPTDLDSLETGGVLHDIGKTAIPDAVLLKKGRLTADERTLMQLHTVIGDRLLRPVMSLQRVRPIVRHHHEHLDGSGYPDALCGDNIPLLAQIVSIVDVFDALTTERPYKPAYSVARAIDELRADVHMGWRRRDLVEEFIATLPSPLHSLRDVPAAKRSS